MKKFNFTLKSVLSYRKHLEKRAQSDVAKALSDVRDCENRISKLNKKYKKLITKFETETSYAMDADRFKNYVEYLETLKTQIITEKGQKKELTDVLKEKQQVLSKKSIDKKVMENLKDRRKKEYYEDLLKKLDKESDDITIIRKAREINQ